MYNIGIIGMGVGEMHAWAYKNHPLCNLKSFCDFDNRKLEDLKRKYSGCEIHSDAKSLINDESINIASVASYDNFHSQQIIQLIGNHKHVMAEKPLCLSRSEMESIRIALDNNPGIALSSNLVLRTNSRFKKIRNDINKNNLGDIHYIEADYYWGRINKLYGWRAEMEYYSIIFGAAIHMIDLVMWLLKKRPISVQAAGNSIATAKSVLNYNSFAILLLKFENGLVAKITGNGGCMHPHYHGLKVFGKEQTAIHNLTGAYYLNSSDADSDQIIITEPYPEKEAREKIIHSFVDHIDNRTIPPIVTRKDVFDVMSVCFAAEEAMIDGNTKIINYLD